MKKVFKIANIIRYKLADERDTIPVPPPEPSEEELTDPGSKMETIPAPAPFGVSDEVGGEADPKEEMRLIDNRINEIRTQLMERLSDEDMELFVEAVNLSAQLEELRSSQTY